MRLMSVNFLTRRVKTEQTAQTLMEIITVAVHLVRLLNQVHFLCIQTAPGAEGNFILM